MAKCDEENQNIKRIIAHNLAFFDDKFGGWSGLVKKTALEYVLSPLQMNKCYVFWPICKLQLCFIIVCLLFILLVSAESLQSSSFKVIIH